MRPLALQAACRPIFIAPNIDPSSLAEAGFHPGPERMEDFLDVSLFETHLVTDRPDAGGVKFFRAELDHWVDGNRLRASPG